MSVIAVGAVHGAPGATSLAFELARRFRDGALLLEADPDGGCLAARLDLAIRPGLTELAGAARMGIMADDIWSYAQSTAIGLAVVVAHPAAEQTLAALRAAGAHIANALRPLGARSGTNVVIDIGRIRPGSPALGLAKSADHTVVVSDNSVEAIVSLTHHGHLVSGCATPMIVMNEARSYSLGDIAAATRQQVWGVVPPGRAGRGQRSRNAAIDELAALLSPANAASLELPDELLADEPHELVVNG